MTATSDWLADEFGDIQPEVARELESRGARQPRPRPAARTPETESSSWMDSLVLILLVIGLLVGGAFLGRLIWKPHPEQSQRIESYPAYAAATNVQVRQRPGRESPVISLLQPNDVVEVFEAQNGWVRVSAGGGEGWIYGGLLRGIKSGWLGSATVLKPVQVRTTLGTESLYLGQKVLIEEHGGPGQVIAILPDGQRLSLPSAGLLFLDARQ